MLVCGGQWHGTDGGGLAARGAVLADTERESVRHRSLPGKRCSGPTFRRDQGGANLPDRMIGRTVCVYARPYA